MLSEPMHPFGHDYRTGGGGGMSQWYGTQNSSSLHAASHPFVPSSPAQQQQQQQQQPGASGGEQPVRRRISRACDQCNQLRTKCDGQQPCSHCDEFGLTCEYARARKKRGKASRKDIAAQQAAAAAAAGGGADARTAAGDETTSPLKADDETICLSRARPASTRTTPPIRVVFAALAMSRSTTRPSEHPPLPGSHINQYGGEHLGFHHNNSQRGGYMGYPYRSGESPLSGGGVLDQSPIANPSSWMSLPVPTAPLYSAQPRHSSPRGLRYTVLRPLLPFIGSIIPTALACDLLELYFTTTTSVFMHPQSPYVTGFVFRKASFLRQSNPRVCSPALLSSMLWIAAQTSDSPFLTSPPSARGRVCQKLLELTIGLLKPLIHTPPDAMYGHSANSGVSAVALGGLGVPLPAQTPQVEDGGPGATGSLDDVMTYAHLATVVSASEYKAASLRWWNAAWSLARELKLGRELPPAPEPSEVSGMREESVEAGSMDGHHPRTNDKMSQMQQQEEREERRRIWWLLYCVDRHLSLCYNKPLALLDVECSELMQPENEVVWQAGEFYMRDSAEPDYRRRRGPPFECTGHGIFGYFLPLMTILGELVELKQARNHPRFGLHFQNSLDWTGQINEITQQLDSFGQSLKAFEEQQGAAQLERTYSHESAALGIDGAHGGIDRRSPPQPTGQQMTESMHQTKIAVAYGTYLMHTMHILLNGKWDPISLLDDNDLWISSQSFVSATGHAVAASEALNDVLDYDPDLSVMPWFFGIYLLQGSFLLMLIADKLQADAGPSVVKACETIVRAHEACVVTLNTEYQRNFRKVMRSALAQVKGRMSEDFGEQQKRRREVLSLYRWTGDGTGLAL
ncbi:fungal-specific transcription factor domain-containing protein [Neohortaea acidophila]|uniref:Fungal-specific transcription factor domain-containing protein n=1 Tax=Neohortaea acidophila TaxID=245834 RepID=A0A6A6PSR4_9PEZI|nr:fungal-specific transcription factor domain-containing protein [Neohortaea acidophila]KAF2483138.1 fungal-specific transcription factor domain-containing protein [Neohortaea acidophila]